MEKVEHVIIIDIDGLRRDVLYYTLALDSLRSEATRQLPHLSKIVGNISLEDITNPDDIELERDLNVTKCDSLLANRCVTVFPSYTYPCQASLFTGLFPKNHGISANFHFDRSGQSIGANGGPEYFTKFDGGRFYVGMGSGNRMLKQGTKTIYDYLYEFDKKCAIVYNFFTSQNKRAIGHVMWNVPWKFEGKGDDIDWIVPNLSNQVSFITERAADGIAAYKENFDEEMMNDAISYINGFVTRKAKPPHLMTLYFGGHDHQAHRQGEVKLQQDYLYKTVDTQIGKFLRYWEALVDDVPSVKNTMFVLCADHGHTETPIDESKRITRKELKGVLQRTESLKYDVFGKGEFFELEEKCNAIISTTAGVAHIYVRRGVFENEKRDWTEPPLYKDIKPILEHFSESTQMAASAQNFLGSAFDFILVKDQESREYKIYEYNLETGHDRDLIPIPDNFAADLGYVLGKERLAELYSDNSGDILLLPNYRNGYRIEKESNLIRSTHGSLQDTDSYIPLIFATPYNRDIIKKASACAYENCIMADARIVDITPTILNQLGVMVNVDGDVRF